MQRELIENIKKINKLRRLKVKLFKIPINIDLRIAADSGTPLVEKSPNHKISEIFKEIAKKIIKNYI